MKLHLQKEVPSSTFCLRISKYLKLSFIFLFNLCIYGQNQYYIINDKLENEISTKVIIDNLSKDLLKNGRFLTPIIYHKISKNDSIINYVSFSAERVKSKNVNLQHTIVYKQDSLYLFLDNKMPKFNLKDLNGNNFSSDQLIGKPVFINFWSTNCGPCIEEFSKLNYLKNKYDKSFQFIAIVDDFDDSKILEILKKHPFNFYILKDGISYRSLIKIKSVPKNIFIDKKGYIKVIRGGLDNASKSKDDNLIDISTMKFEVIIKALIENNKS